MAASKFTSESRGRIFRSNDAWDQLMWVRSESCSVPAAPPPPSLLVFSTTGVAQRFIYSRFCDFSFFCRCSSLHGEPHLSPGACWDNLQPSATLGKMSGWTLKSQSTAFTRWKHEVCTRVSILLKLFYSALISCSCRVSCCSVGAVCVCSEEKLHEQPSVTLTGFMLFHYSDENDYICQNDETVLLSGFITSAVTLLVKTRSVYLLKCTEQASLHQMETLSLCPKKQKVSQEYTLKSAQMQKMHRAKTSNTGGWGETKYNVIHVIISRYFLRWKSNILSF